MRTILKIIFFLTVIATSFVCAAKNKVNDFDNCIMSNEKDELFEYDSLGIPIKNVYSSALNKSNCFFVISKVAPVHLNVYEVVDRDTLLLATYPICISKCIGQKERKGDNKTPESFPEKPFIISQIQDSSNWYHDFGDGRGSILAYGKYFLRLDTPGFRGIGIHGSTGNRESIKQGRCSEGCIRLLDEDIVHLYENYTIIGTKVIILPESIGPLPFEVSAFANRMKANN